ncbi:DUF397 domain-containing protein [Actinophytocola algeriensis]|uniref:DUF397 domain-containing protein n=1 Tax=Actinophytocola algeriensis TaxID=1768010 RepID=A0A7W7VDJ9_9PSEU|nr:DUF397 domain-containing protein [Actinophytocola algeriensis]MBB4906283.1 hypothetical protein [Actinophytocola algeriensis]MBE1477764.1 hypothetical protein [Actinophytocola algeriensis]
MWRKSSKSDSGGQCVEVRSDLGALRDSKQPGGPALVTPELGALIKRLKSGQ